MAQIGMRIQVGSRDLERAEGELGDAVQGIERSIATPRSVVVRVSVEQTALHRERERGTHKRRFVRVRVRVALERRVRAHARERRLASVATAVRDLRRSGASP